MVCSMVSGIVVCVQDRKLHYFLNAYRRNWLLRLLVVKRILFIKRIVLYVVYHTLVKRMCQTNVRNARMSVPGVKVHDRLKWQKLSSSSRGINVEEGPNLGCQIVL